MRKILALFVAAASTVGVGALVPTAAEAACAPAQVPACSGGTAVTATVGIAGVGVVSIAVPAALALTQTGSTLSGTAATPTTITDTRVTSGSWTVTANVSNLTLSGAASSIPASGNASMYTSTPLVATAGTANVTDSYTSSGSALSLSNTDSTLMTATTANANVVTYTPTLIFQVPNGTPMGLYTGTLTQTVS